MRFPTRFQTRTLWNAATGVAILIIGSLIVGLIWLVGEIFSFLQPVLVPLAVAGIIAYLLDPVVRLFEKRGMTRVWAVTAVFGMLLLVVGLLTLAILPGIHQARMAVRGVMATSPQAAPIANQAASTPALPSDAPPSASGAVVLLGSDPAEYQNLVTNLARSLHNLRERNQGTLIGWALAGVDDDGRPLPAPATGEPPPATLDFFWQSRAGRALDRYKGVIATTAWNWISAGTTKVLGFLALVLGMIMVPVYLFFFLKDSASIRDHWHEYVPLRASRFKTELIDTLQEINGYLISFFRGQVVVALIDGILVGVALAIFGLPYGFLIGVFMAILGIIPYIGNIVCLIPACVIAYLHAQSSAPFGLSPWGYVLGVVIIFVAVQQINSLVTAPKIVGDSVGLHPLTVIFSMLFWSMILGGFVGALLAVPLTAAMKVLLRRFFWERKLMEPADPRPLPA